MRKWMLLVLVLATLALEAPQAMAAPNDVAYSPPDMSSVGTAQLRHYYQWRQKMDWMLAPIHTRADLERYLKHHENSPSPLDALSPDARKRVLSTLHFGPHGAFLSNYGDLQYLSTREVYEILALFGEQNEALTFTGGTIRAASPRSSARPGKPSRIVRAFTHTMQALDQSLGEPRARRVKKAKREYARRFARVQSPESVRHIASHDLRLLFRAALRTAFVTLEARYVRDAHRDFAEMEKRQFAGPPDIEGMYKALARTRQFEPAHKFYKAHPDAGLTPLPAYRDEAKHVGAGAPTLLEVSPTKRLLTRRPVNLDKPAQVVILTDPHCHFCAKFEHALQSRPELRTTLAYHSLWITPPIGVTEFDTLQQWNKAHPTMQLHIMYDADAWSMIKMLAVPQFFFLENGQVVKHQIGWKGAGDLDVIDSDLQAIGSRK
jgi:hypothetical protein